MSIDLLLANEKGHQVVEQGLPDDVDIWFRGEPEDEGGIEAFPRFDADPNDLSKQRWGIVAPEGSVGDRLLQVIAPLTAARREQQEGHEPLVFRAAAGMSSKKATDWWGAVYNDSKINFRDRPRYLLILGDADLISWEAQQRFSAAAFAGRLAFKKESEYEAYVHKILAYERAAKHGSKKIRAAYHTVRDGTAATSVGHRGLMVPSVDDAKVALKDNAFPASEIVDFGATGVTSPEDFLRAVANREPTTLFSISHGLGIDAHGTEEERRRFQGAMSFGSGKKITADDVANRPFLPGGAWFFFACFGAGTPSQSAYTTWLQALKEAKINLPQSQIDAVLQSLAQQGSFVAALPQAALANPDGPLAIMSHVDLAWTFSFQDLVSKKYQSHRFHGIFQGIIEHSRVGACLDTLQRTFNDANTDLTVLIDAEESAKRRNEPVENASTAALEKAALWMLRQDIGAYVMLGDPAAQVMTSTSVDEVREMPSIVTTKVPIASSTAAESTSKATAIPSTESSGAASNSLSVTAGGAPSTLASIDAARIEAAVFAKVGNEAMDAVAAHFRVSRNELDDWVRKFLEGGRTAVGNRTQ